MNNIHYTEYVPLNEKQFKMCPIQKCPTCSKNNKQYQMATSNDGNKFQKCSTCGWEWRYK